ncbi:putative O-methyltransferase YrrM [Streptosporangium becharense]|uniref:Putative O-methyltransferase YrrM n=1 Tax=Streptosporangium becharense TaxID=1816182 RepID=A0A7W9IJI8_9ACTN|nr:O-methyltransferase [Streptosporangium becharense]MBB2913509.1 putative O-methyltransferase YrrM [Streptosporangium becharense]MBB5821199.1 putative O-methyltransferase YrrM [Streptosporangium becharense]
MAETPTSPLEAALAYAEEFHAEDDILRAARLRAAEVGAPPVLPGGGAALCFLATAVNARAVVEIGTGCGVSGLWLLRGMRQDGTLTSVDVEPEHQRLARQSFAQAGFSGGRVRLITGRALDVLPRLSDGGYDLVFCDGSVHEYPDYLAESVRLLRVGGVVVFTNALWGNRVTDPTRRDPETVTVRELGKLVRSDERLRPLMMPLGDGILAAVKLSD